MSTYAQMLGKCRFFVSELDDARREGRRGCARVGDIPLLRKHSASLGKGLKVLEGPKFTTQL